jgi:hypothetical protein
LRSAAPNEREHETDDRQNNEKMNGASKQVEPEPADQPEDQKNNREGVKHFRGIAFQACGGLIRKIFIGKKADFATLAALQNKSHWRRILILCALFSLGASAHASEHWVTYENCRLLTNPANDGDSFHVRAEGREYIFRLYFVDSPETESSLPERIAEQAKYFQTTPEEVLGVGVAAEHFTTQTLGRPSRS